MNVTILSGGRGSTNIIKALLLNNKYRITSIINTFDDGKSTGIIREYFDMPGPSDIRKIHSLYLNKNEKDYKINKKLFDFRIKNIDNANVLNIFKNYINKKDLNLFNIKFKNKKIEYFIRNNLKIFYNHIIKKNKKNNQFNFSDCSLMNCVYAGSYLKNNNNLIETLKEFEKVFNLVGNIVPITKKNLFLSAILINGKILKSEESIINKKINKDIERLILTKKPAKFIINNSNDNKAYKKLLLENYKYKISNEAKKTIKNTNLLIFSPGTLHSSLLPTYLSVGLKKIIYSNKKMKKIIFTNIQNEPDTYGYNAIDYINKTLDYLNIKNLKLRNNFFDNIFINRPKINDDSFVKFDDSINYEYLNIVFKRLHDKNFFHNRKKIFNVINNF